MSVSIFTILLLIYFLENKIKTINDLENKRDIVCKRKIELNKIYFIYIYNFKTCSLKILKSSIFLIWMGKALYNVAPIEKNPHFAYFSFVFGTL